MDIHVQYGDPSSSTADVSVSSYTDLSTSGVLTFTYPDAGSYVVTVTATNSRNQQIATANAYTDYEIAGFSCSCVGATPGNSATLSVSASSGSNIVVYIDAGNGHVIEQLFASYDSITSFQYDYGGTAGSYNTVNQGCNSLGCSNCAGQCGIAISLPDDIDVSYAIAKTNVSHDFTRTMTAGPDMAVTTGVYYGDESVDLVYDLEPPSVEVFNHTYVSPGLYSFRLNMYNPISSKTITYNQPVYNSPGNLTALQSVYSAKLGEGSFTMDFTVSDGTNLTITLKIDGSEVSANVVYDQVNEGISSGTISLDVSACTLCTVGSHTAVLEACNPAACSSTDITMNFEEEITGFATSCNPCYISTVGGSLDVWANITGGTNPAFSFTHTSSGQLDVYNVAQDTGNREMKHTYDLTGPPMYYTINVSAFNNVSCAYEQLIVGVEEPIVPSVLTVSATNQSDPANPVPFDATCSGPPNPTSVRVNITFGNDGSVTTQDAPDMENTCSFSIDHSFSTFNDFNCTFCFYNNISKACISVPVRVGVEIPDTSIQLPSGELEKDVAYDFTAMSSAGSETVYKVNWCGTTGEVSRSSSDWTSSDSTPLSHTFAVGSQICTITIAAENVFGIVYGPSHEVVINERVAGLSCEADAPHVQVGNLVCFSCTVTAGTSVNVEVQFGDGSTDAKLFSDASLDSSKVDPLSFCKMYMQSSLSECPTFTASTALQDSISFDTLCVKIEDPLESGSLAFSQSMPVSWNVELPVDFELCIVQDVMPSDPRCKWTIEGVPTEFIDSPPTITELPSCPYSILYQHQFLTAGEKTVSVKCENFISSDQLSSSFKIEEPLEGASITLATPYIKVGDYAEFILACTKGTNLQVDVAYGDGTSDLLSHSSCTSDFTFTHTYSTSISAVVNIDIFNSITTTGSFSFTELVSVQIPIPEAGFILLNNGPIAFERGGSSSVDLVITTDPLESLNENPTNIQFAWDFEDTNIFVDDTLMSRDVYSEDIVTSREYQDDGNLVGFRMARVNMSNAVSFAILETQIKFVEIIMGLSHTIGNNFATFEDISFSISLETGSHVNISICYHDDNACAESNFDGMYDTSTFTLVYEADGSYNVIILAVNDVSELSLTHSIRLFHKLVEDRVSITPLLAHPGLDIPVATIAHVAETPVPTEVYIAGDAQPISFPHNASVSEISISDIGDFEIEITLENTVSQLVETAEIKVVEPITNARVECALPIADTTEIYYVEVNTVFHCTVLLDGGSHIEVEIEDGLGGSNSQNHPQQTLEIIWESLYDIAGIIEANILLSNDWNSASLPISLYSLNPLDDFDIEINSPLATGSDLQLYLVSASSDHAEVSTIDFGDGSEVVISEAAFKEGVFHTYPLSDIQQFFTLSVSVITPISPIIQKESEIIIQVPVEGISCQINGEDCAVDGEINVNLGEELTFTAQVEKGDPVTFEWALPDKVIEGNTITYAFESIHDYDLLLTARNLVSTETFVQRIKVESNVQIESFTSSSYEVEIEDKVTLTLTTVNEVGDVCFEFELVCVEDCKDPEFKYLASNLELCERTQNGAFDGEDIELTDSSTTENQMKWILQAPGLYTITVRPITSATETSSDISGEELTIRVKDKPCEIPEITSRYESPLEFFRSEDAWITMWKVFAKKHECLIESIKWRFVYSHFVVQEDGTEMEIAKPEGLIYADDGAYFSANTAPEDDSIYRLNIKFIFARPFPGVKFKVEGYDDLEDYIRVPKLESEGTIFYKFRRTPLAGIIDGGSEMLLSPDIQKSLAINVEDPDKAGDLTHLQCQLHCSSVNEKDNFNNVTWNTDEVSSKTTTNKVCGCFGSCPGLSEKFPCDKEITINTGNMRPDFKYNLTLHVISTSDERELHYSQIWNIASGIVLGVAARSHSSNGKDANKLNPQSTLVFEAEITDLGIEIDDVKFMWKIIPKEIAIGDEKSANDIVWSVTDDGTVMEIEGNSLNFGSVYDIKVEAELKNGQSSEPGISVITIKTSCKPTGGVAFASTEKAIPLQDITVWTEGWKCDCDGLGKPQKYSFGYIDTSGGKSNIIYATLDTDLKQVDNFVVPEGGDNGLLTLVIQATDDIGITAVTELIITSQYPAPPPGVSAEEQANNLVNEKLDSIDPTSDPEGALGALTACVSTAGSTAGPTAGGSVQGEESAKDQMASKMSGMVRGMFKEGTPVRPTVALAAISVVGNLLETFSDENGKAPMTASSDTADIISKINIENVKDAAMKTTMTDKTVSAIAGISKGQVPIIKEMKIPDPDEVYDPAAEEKKLEMEEKQMQKEKDLQKSVIAALERFIDQCLKSFKDLPMGGAAKVFGNNDTQLTIQRVLPKHLDEKKCANPTGQMTIPKEIKEGTKFMINPDILLMTVYQLSNVRGWDKSAKGVGEGAGSNELIIVDSFNDPIFSPAGPQNDMSNADAAGNFVNMSNATRSEATGLIYMFTFAETEGTFVCDLKPSEIEIENGLEFVVYVKLNAKHSVVDQPNATHYDIQLVVNRHVKWKAEINETIVKQYWEGGDSYKMGIYIAIEFTYANDRRKKREAIEAGEDPHVTANETTVPEFAMRTGLTNCRAWDSKQEIWRTDVCRVKNDSAVGETKCECDKLDKDVKTYSGGFKAPTVNTIDFANIFANFAELLAAAPTVFATILSLLFVYVIMGIIVRRMDKKDIERWSAAPLQDNVPEHRYFYKVSIYTGLRKNAGTKSNVCCIFSGEHADSGIRLLEDGKGKHFKRGSLRHFILSSHGALGQLTFCRIWHDNSGEGENGGWYLDKVVVEDLQTTQRWFFLCSDWLAVDESDGQVDRLLPVAANDEITGFQHLFFSKARKNLTDDHIWISILSRPTKSNFTRLQRLTCGISLLFSTMIANAMFYRETDYENDAVLIIGPVTLSAATIITSIYGSLTVIPINTIIITFFRKSCPKGWTESNEQELAELKKAHQTENSTDESTEETESKKKMRWWKKKYPLPYWCIYIAWVLAILAILISCWFVIFYSLEWGKQKSEEWLSSLLLSFVQSAVLVQPMKVIFVAMLVSLIFKTLDEMDEDKDPKEVAVNQQEKEGPDIDPIITMKHPTISVPQPPNQRQLEKARLKREHEKKMWDTIREVSFYFCFVVLVCFIAWGPQDSRVFMMNDHIHNMFQGDNGRMAAKDVRSGFDFWKFMNKTAVPVLYFANLYNGQITTRRERQFLEDFYSFRVGSVRLRQNRVVPAKCNTVGVMAKHALECNKEYSMTDEDDRNFTVEWIEDHGEHTDSQDTFELSWKYFDSLDLKGLPYIGLVTTYSGGGYVADLGISEYHASKQLAKLVNHSWIDHYTRSVFLEFTIYNPNMNLFAYVNYLFEFPSTGGILPFERVMSFQVYSAMDGIGMVVIAAQFLYILVLLFFVLKEGNKMRKGMKEYFKEPWNIVEIIIIVISFCAIGMYALRELFGRMVMETLKKNREGFTNYMAMATYDENLSYVVGTLVFIANLKFLRLLRFNKHVCNFTATLKKCRKDLMYFFVTFFIIFMGFSMWAAIIFGSALYGFSSFLLVLQTLFALLLGKMDDVDSMEEANQYLGKVFFISFVLLIFFLAMNMFLGIIGTAYSEVCELRLEGEQSDLLVVDFVKEKLSTLICGKKPEECDVYKPDMTPAYRDSLHILDKRLESIDFFITEQYKHAVDYSCDKKGKLTDQAMEERMAEGLRFLNKLQIKSVTHK